MVDLGAGSGYFTVRLAALGAHVIAEDIDQRFLDYIDKRAAKEKKSSLISTRLGAKDDPHLPPDTADSVLIVGAYHLENRVVYLKHVAEAIRPGGRFSS